MSSAHPRTCAQASVQVSLALILRSLVAGGKRDAHVATELAVGDGLDADVELTLDLVLDGLVLDSLELLTSALALVVLVALGEERVGTCGAGGGVVS